MLEGLKRLEYRGYDSAGLATLVDGRIERRRAEGKLGNLAAVLEAQPLPGLTGIGHTRWATHGGPTERNAHPHATARVAAVHNGSIENFAALRAELEAAGQRREGLRVRRGRDAEPLEHGRRPRLERVAPRGRDRVLEVREPHRVPLAVVDDPRALLQGAPRRSVAGHRQVEDDLVDVEEAVLAEDADARARRERHAPVRRRLVPREDLQERGLPRAVRADEAVAGAGVELERRVREERAVAVRLA